MVEIQRVSRENLYLELKKNTFQQKLGQLKTVAKDSDRHDTSVWKSSRTFSKQNETKKVYLWNLIVLSILLYKIVNPGRGRDTSCIPKLCIPVPVLVTCVVGHKWLSSLLAAVQTVVWIWAKNETVSHVTIIVSNISVDPDRWNRFTSGAFSSRW
jgi:hypothetical protein